LYYLIIVDEDISSLVDAGFSLRGSKM